jgi:hypothetical protein
MSPQELSELHRIALVNTGDKQQARRCVEAYLAGADSLLPHNRTTTMIWVRVGDSGEYASFDDLQEVVNHLNELGIGRIDHWRSAGIETCNYHGHDYISLYHGDTDGNLKSDLLPDERVFVEDNLQECYQ